MDIHSEKWSEYACNLCNKIYKTYKSLWNHNAKFHKKLCCPNVIQSVPNVVQEFQCNYCEKKYSNRHSKSKHQKICSKKKINNQNINGDNSNIIKGNNNNNNIHINYFQNDNLSFITPEFFKKLVKETLFDDEHCNIIPKMIKEVKFNKSHPENHNIKMANSKSKKGEIYTKEGWKKIDEDLCVDFLSKRGYQIFSSLSEVYHGLLKGNLIESKEIFEENYLNGNIKEETQSKLKVILVDGSKSIRKQTRQELEEELSKELII
jgi:hypothetical protein